MNATSMTQGGHATSIEIICAHVSRRIWSCTHFLGGKVKEKRAAGVFEGCGLPHYLLSNIYGNLELESQSDLQPG